MMKEENENDDFVVIKLNVKPKIGVPPNLKLLIDGLRESDSCHIQNTLSLILFIFLNTIHYTALHSIVARRFSIHKSSSLLFWIVDPTLPPEKEVFAPTPCPATC